MSAINKLSTQIKNEKSNLSISTSLDNIIIDSSSWGDSRSFSEKLHLFETCIKENIVVEIEYVSMLGKK